MEQSQTKRIIKHVVWLLLFGIWGAFLHVCIALALIITIIASPLCYPHFKIALFFINPFDREIVTNHDQNLAVNMIYLWLNGWPFIILYAVIGGLCYITVVGIPVAKIFFKAASLCVFPFGARIHHIINYAD